MTPIYIDIYSQRHLENYLQRRQLELTTKPASIPNSPVPSADEDAQEDDDVEIVTEPVETILRMNEENGRHRTSITIEPGSNYS